MKNKQPMNSYVGCKIIKAYFIPAGKSNWSSDGYEVHYPDGYISWSPKKVFETAYRLIEDNEKELIND